MADVPEAPELKRSLFGYRPSDVESLIEARERMFERVTEDASNLKAENERLRADVDRARAETRTLREETETLREQSRSARAAADTAGEDAERARAETMRAQEQGREAELRAGELETELRDARRELTDLAERLRVADATEADLRSRLDQASLVAPGEPRELGAVLEATQQAIARIMEGARQTAEDDLGRVHRARDEIQAEVDRVRVWRDRVEPLTASINDSIAAARGQMSQTAERVGDALRPMSDALATLGRLLDELARQTLGASQDADRAPERVDLVSHESEHEHASRHGSDEHEPAEEEHGAPQQARAGAPLRADPWPDPWR